MTDLAGLTVPSFALWRAALAEIQDAAAAFLSQSTYYSTQMGDSHGCPPPFPELQPEAPQSCDTLWQERPVLWAYPGSLQRRAQWDGGKVPVACLGTTFWLLFHALKHAGFEYLIDKATLERFKATSLLHPQGIAYACVEAGWASQVYHDPTQAKEGHVGAIGYFDDAGNGELHHWFVVGRNAQMMGKDGKPAVNTWAASPDAGGAGFDWYSHERESRKHPGRFRRWFLAAPFAG